MTSIQRIKEILIGLGMIIMSVLMLLDPDGGFGVITFIICTALLLRGIGFILYYYRMARHMVEGRRTFYVGVILLDISMVGFMLTNFPLTYVVVYLLGLNAFTGGVDVLNALQAKKVGTPWKGKLIQGMVGILIALLCVYYGFIKDDINVVVYLYAAGLLYAAVSRIAGAFRKTAIVYIQ